MSGRHDKKIRQEFQKSVDKLRDAAEREFMASVSKASLWERIKFAWRVIFR